MQSKSFASSVVKATALALVISLCGILVFALVVKLVAPSDGVIKTVNQFIKVASLFVGCFFAVKGNLGIVKGAIVGALCSFLLYAIFAITSGSQLFSLSMLADVAFSAVVGAISGVIAVNTKGKE